ncbi:MAG: DNA cytosine methyltransferase, partial [Sandaracinaceae bacterium]|nr:DNA cytosine methyltransferase [Sandaracinaceae bacterium]
MVEQLVDLLCGGFPCQDVSLAGSGRGLDGERSGLWSEMRRVAAELAPRPLRRDRRRPASHQPNRLGRDDRRRRAQAKSRQRAGRPRRARGSRPCLTATSSTLSRSRYASSISQAKRSSAHCFAPTPCSTKIPSSTRTRSTTILTTLPPRSHSSSARYATRFSDTAASPENLALQLNPRGPLQRSVRGD